MSDFSQEAEQEAKQTINTAKNIAKTTKKTMAAVKKIAAAKSKSKLIIAAIIVAFVLIVTMGLPITIFGVLHSYYGDNPEPVSINALGANDDTVENCYYHVTGNADGEDDQNDDTYTNDANTSILHNVELIVNRLNERVDDIKNAIPYATIREKCEAIFLEKTENDNGGPLNSDSAVMGTGINSGLVTARTDTQTTEWTGTTINVNCDNLITYHQALRILAAYNAQTTSRSTVKENGTTSYDLGKETLSTWLGTDTNTRGNVKKITFQVAGDVVGTVDSYEGRFLPQYLYEQREQDINNRPTTITSDEDIAAYNEEIEEKYNDNMCALVDLLLTVSGPSNLESCVQIDDISSETLSGKTQHAKYVTKYKTTTTTVKEPYETEEWVSHTYYYRKDNRVATTSNQTSSATVGTFDKNKGYVSKVVKLSNGTYNVTRYPVCTSSATNATAITIQEKETVTKYREKTTTTTTPYQEKVIENGSANYTHTTYVGHAEVNITITSRNFDEIAKNMGFWCGDKTQPQGVDVWSASIYSGGLYNTGTTISAKEVMKNADKAKLLTGYDYAYVVRYIAEASENDKNAAKTLAAAIYSGAQKANLTPEQYVLKTYDKGTRNSRNSVTPTDEIYDVCYEALHAQDSITSMKEKFKNREYAQSVLGYDYVTVVQTVMREVGGGSTENKKAVCQVIINRANAQNTNPYKIVSATGQFSAFTDLWDESKTTEEVWDICFEMFVLGGTYSPVKNANYYYSTAGGFVSDWHETLQFICQIETHRFFYG